MLMDLIDQLLIDAFQLWIEFGNLVIQFNEWVFIRKSAIEVSNCVKIWVLKILWHIECFEILLTKWLIDKFMKYSKQIKIGANLHK